MLISPAPEPSTPSILNDRSKMESPLFRLPTELTMHIFQQCGSDIRSRITLTHTCRRWRRIAVNDASLWTNVFIQTRVRKINARLDHFLAILGMQLDRTAHLPLDVEWVAEIGDEFFIGALNLLREKAPFHRWRTLVAQITGELEVPWTSLDAFTNLESLWVCCSTSDNFISAIDCTITSSLKILDLRTWPPGRLKRLMSSFANSFRHISTFRFGEIPFTLRSLILHDNVVNLCVQWGQDHLHPHIRRYEVESCIFGQICQVDLGNLTTLIVGDSLTVDSDCLFLPALQKLKLGWLDMSFGAKFEAPALDAIHFLKDSHRWAKTRRREPSSLEGALRNRGYRLSPNASLVIDFPLPSTTLIAILTKSPKATHVTLRLDDWAGARPVLSRLLAFPTEPDSTSVKETLWPRLSELRLNLDWEISEPSESKGWLLDALKTRRGSGFSAPLSLYVCWKGEGTYVPLTGD